MHPVVTRNHFARVDFGQQPTLQALERRIGRLIAKEDATNISAGTGRVNQGSMRHERPPFYTKAIIADHTEESTTPSRPFGHRQIAVFGKMTVKMRRHKI
jgi:hypothetical protein